VPQSPLEAIRPATLKLAILLALVTADQPTGTRDLRWLWQVLLTPFGWPPQGLLTALAVTAAVGGLIGYWCGPYSRSEKAWLDIAVTVLAGAGILPAVMEYRKKTLLAQADYARAQATEHHQNRWTVLQTVASMSPCGPRTLSITATEFDKREFCSWARFAVVQPGERESLLPDHDPDSTGWVPKRMPEACVETMVGPRAIPGPRPRISDAELLRLLNAFESQNDLYNRWRARECSARGEAAASSDWTEPGSILLPWGLALALGLRMLKGGADLREGSLEKKKNAQAMAQQ
jgi:hypothetical protein